MRTSGVNSSVDCLNASCRGVALVLLTELETHCIEVTLGVIVDGILIINLIKFQ